MRAVVLYEHGGLDKLIYESNYPDPKPGPGDVILRVRACSLNYHDVFTRRGMPGIKLNLPVIVGIDLAGDIAEIGPEVTGWKSGDRVLLDPINRVEGGLTGEMRDGGLAEYVRVRHHQLIRLDPAVSYAAAAALPTAYGTAYRMMLRRGQIRAGEKVLILGASGGVGTAAVQIAKMIGAEVIAAAGGDDKLAKLRELGADHLVNYKTQDFSKEVWRITGKQGVDVVVNYTGGDTWVPSLKTLRRRGRALTCGATAGYDPKEDLRYIWVRELEIIGCNGWTKEDIATLLDYVATGRIKPVVSHVLPLSQGREAEWLLEQRAVFGKVLLVP